MIKGFQRTVTLTGNVSELKTHGFRNVGIDFAYLCNTWILKCDPDPALVARSDVCLLLLSCLFRNVKSKVSNTQSTQSIKIRM